MNQRQAWYTQARLFFLHKENSLFGLVREPPMLTPGCGQKGTRRAPVWEDISRAQPGVLLAHEIILLKLA